jgi:hypothetical protein
MCFFNVKKGSIQGLICFKLVLGFWSLDPCLKWPLRCKVSQKCGFHIAKFGIASCGHKQYCNFSVLTFWKLEPAGKCKAYVFSKSKNKFWHNRTRLDHYHGPWVLRKQRTRSKNLYPKPSVLCGFFHEICQFFGKFQRTWIWRFVLIPKALQNQRFWDSDMLFFPQKNQSQWFF